MLRPRFTFGLAQSARDALGVGTQQGPWHGAGLSTQRELLKLKNGERVQSALPDDDNGLTAGDDLGPSATVLDNSLLSGEEEGQRRKPFISSRLPWIIGHPLEPLTPADVAAGRATDVAAGRATDLAAGRAADVARVLGVPAQFFSQRGVLPFGLAPVVNLLRNSFPKGVVPWLPGNGFRSHPGLQLQALHSFSQQNRDAPVSASGATSDHKAASAANVVPPLLGNASSLSATSAGAAAQRSEHRDGSSIALEGSTAAPALQLLSSAWPTKSRRPEIDASPLQEAAAVAIRDGHGKVRKRQQKEAAEGGKFKAADGQKMKRWQGGGDRNKGSQASVPRAAPSSVNEVSQGVANCAEAQNFTRRREAGRQGGQQAAAGSTLSGTRFQVGDVGDTANWSPAQAESSKKTAAWRERAKPFVSEVLLSLRKMHLQTIAQGEKMDAGHVEKALKWVPFVDEYAAAEVLKQERDPDIAMAFFDWAKAQKGFEVTCYHYTTLIGIAGRAKAGEMLQKVVGEMEAKGIKKTNVTYNLLINAFKMLGMHEKALAITKEMDAEGEPMDLHTFSLLMDLHLKDGRPEECLQVFDKIKASSLTAHGYQVAIAMKALAATGRVKEAVLLFEERRAQLSTPCTHSYNAIIHVLAKSGQFEKALEIFEQLRRTGVAINKHTYTAAIDMYGMEGRFSEAEQIFNEIKPAWVKQDVEVWSTMVSMWGRAEQPHRAAFWFRRTLQSGVMPTVQCYNSLMSSFLRADMFDEAKLVLTSMLSQGLKPSPFTYAMVLSECTLCKSEQGIVAMMNLLDMMKHPGQELLRGLLQIAKQKESDLLLLEGPVRARINAVWDQVDREDYKEKFVLASSVINYLAKNKAWKTAACFLDMVHERGIFSRLIVLDGYNGALKVDLQNMSTGTALVALSWTFKRIREGGLELSNPPAEMHIITGVKRRANRREVSSINDVVRCLEGAESPFQVYPHNVGSLIASMASVEWWLASDACLRFFPLIDNI